jgi:hypothetical protein
MQWQQLALSAALLAAIGHVAPTSAQGTSRALTTNESSLAAKLEESAALQWRTIEPMASVFSSKAISKLGDTPSGKRLKSLVTEITLLGSPGTTSLAERRAMVTRYDYATGLTLRTTVDLSKGKVLDVKADANRPTPLAVSEVQRAIEIASEVMPELKGALLSRVRALSVIQSAPKNQRYGHRLAVLWQDEPASKGRVLVDLSTEEVAERNY